MVERQPLSIVAIFSEDYTEADVNSAKAELMKLGFDRLYLMTSQPPRLSVALSADENQDRIDEVVALLGGVEHVEGVRISHPSWRQSP